MSKQVTKRLGRGLSSLIRSDLGGESEVASPVASTSQPSSMPLAEAPKARHPGGITSLRLDQIRTNPSQPRRTFDPDRLAALAESLKQRGALQPVVVRPIEGGYELVAGERRLRASKLAGLTEIPVVIRHVADGDLLELALIENIHRENLNPVEKARAYQRLAQKHGLSHDEIAQRMGEDRSSVANTIRLLGLSDRCLSLLASGELSVGHAKVLLSVADPAKQVSLAEQGIQEGWSVRRIEQEAAGVKTALISAVTAESESGPTVRPAVREMEERLSAAVGTRVKIREGRRRNTGKIVIAYYNLEDFERISAALGVTDATDTI